VKKIFIGGAIETTDGSNHFHWLECCTVITFLKEKNPGNIFYWKTT
jgi:hypothetical protein